MGLLKRFWRHASQALPRPDPPGPARLSCGETGGNPIHGLLDEIGLPWREPRGEVEARCGRRPDSFYRRDAVFFDTATPLPGFIAPWKAEVFENFAPDLPIAHFSGLVWFEDDAHTNLRRTASQLSQRLGSVEIGQRYNTLACEWRSGTASLGLIAWPPQWQSTSLRNDAHEREPRLVTACRVNLTTGFRLPLSEREEEWVGDLRSLVPAVPVQTVPMARIAQTAPGETELEYARDPGKHLATVHGRLGCSARREALIVCTHQLFVVARGDVLGFDVIRLLPAKGGGGASLRARCRTSCPGVAFKTITLTQHGEPDGLNEVARQLGDLFDRPVEIGPYFDDV